MSRSISPEHAEQIKTLFDEAVDLDVDARSAFLDQACHDNTGLRREVEALLVAYDNRAGDLRHALEHLLLAPQPTTDGLGEGGDLNTDPLVGQTISRYQIVEKLGGGGMGVVYLARDTKLDRLVALKFLPPHLGFDDEAKARFIHEAKAASALDHNNICTVYDIDETEQGQLFIAMAFYAGETLKKKIAWGALPVEEALDYAVQIAQGLQQAHEAGIVHRDIKPANVMVTEQGRAKIVDFGLAKMADVSLTQTGTTLGTVAYMSPEQALGQKVDHRTDLWSLGVVLYEMLAGERPFQGYYAEAIIYAIRHDEPKPMAALRPEVPEALEEVVETLLQKSPDERYQHMDELLVDLRSLLREREPESPKGVPAPAPSSRLRRRLRYGSIAVLVLVGAGVLLWQQAATWFANTPEEPMKTVRFTSFPGFETSPTFSPDGSQIAFSWQGDEGNEDIYVKLIGAGAYRPRRLTTHPGHDVAPVWSPDGRYIAFVRLFEDDWGIYRMTVFGEEELKLRSRKHLSYGTGFGRVHLSWSPDSQLLAFVDADTALTNIERSLYLMTVESREVHQLTSPPSDKGDAYPAISPDGTRVAFVRADVFEGKGDLYIVPISGGEPERLTEEEAWFNSIAWTPDGREIIYRSASEEGEGLWRIPATGGAPVKLQMSGANVAALAVSPDGQRLAYEEYIRSVVDYWRYEIPSSGSQETHPIPFITSSEQEWSPDYSPDGKRVAFASARTGVFEIWVCDSTGQNPVQLTYLNQSRTGTPRWSPDGQRIAFDAPEGNGDILVIDAQGGNPQRLTTAPSQDLMPSWSPDGRWIYFTSNRSGVFQIWKLPVEGGSPVQITRHGGEHSYVSPDGDWLYYFTPDSLWKMPTEGGEASLVYPFREDHPAKPHYNGWGDIVLFDDGFYYHALNEREQTDIKFFDFRSGAVTTIMEIKDKHWYFTVSPDRRYVLYPKVARKAQSDIVLVENWR